MQRLRKNVQMQKVALIALISVLITVAFVFAVENYKTAKEFERYRDQNSCMFNICTRQGTRVLCFGIEEIDCTVMKDKCMDASYMMQWGLKCEWDGTLCECLPSTVQSFMLL